MRLITIILIGLVCIAATYFYTSSSQGQQQSPNSLPVQTNRSNSSQIRPKLSEKVEPALNANQVRKEKPESQANQSQSVGPGKEAQTEALKSDSTPLETARAQARSSLSKNDPFAPLTDLRPFPGSYAPDMPPSQASTPGSPLASKTKPGKKESDMVPPPPPTMGSAISPNEMPSGLSFGDLPMPPERQGLATKITLVGIVGNQCIFNVNDPTARRQHHWPKTFSLTQGESFDQMRLLEVNLDSAVVEEGGERITKSLPAVR